MAKERYDVVGIGNAIVDIISRCDDGFLSKHDLAKGFMRLIDAEEANRLYADLRTGRPRPGVTTRSRGGDVSRFGAVLRQFDLTYDVENLGDGGLMRLLPREFDRWKEKALADIPKRN